MRCRLGFSMPRNKTRKEGDFLRLNHKKKILSTKGSKGARIKTSPTSKDHNNHTYTRSYHQQNNTPIRLSIQPICHRQSIIWYNQMTTHTQDTDKKRHRRVLRNSIFGISKPAIHRLARQGGVKWISGLIYEETQEVLIYFLENILRDAITYMMYARRKTMTATDVVYALKRQGKTVYGFGI